MNIQRATVKIKQDRNFGFSQGEAYFIRPGCRMKDVFRGDQCVRAILVEVRTGMKVSYISTTGEIVEVGACRILDQ